MYPLPLTRALCGRRVVHLSRWVKYPHPLGSIRSYSSIPSPKENIEKLPKPILSTLKQTLRQSPMTPQEYAFCHRIGFDGVPSDLFLKAITHPSIQPDNAEYEKFSLIGGKVVRFFVSEYLNARYPRLFVEDLRWAMDHFSNPEILYNIGKTYGLQDVVACHENNEKEKQAIVAQTVLSLIGVLFQEKGEKATRSFIHSNFSNQTSYANLFNHCNQPKRFLTALMKRQKKELPLSRLLHESGRHGHSPIFVVGAFSGLEKLGEGYGHTLRSAENNAAVDALKKHFLVERPDAILPSSRWSKANTIVLPNAIEDTTPIGL